MYHSLSNKCAKNLCKRTVLVQLIIENVIRVFLRHIIEYQKLELLTFFVLWDRALNAVKKSSVLCRSIADDKVVNKLWLTLLSYSCSVNYCTLYEVCIHLHEH